MRLFGAYLIVFCIARCTTLLPKPSKSLRLTELFHLNIGYLIIVQKLLRIANTAISLFSTADLLARLNIKTRIAVHASCVGPKPMGANCGPNRSRNRSFEVDC
jgi:hypothetical protein